MMIDHFEWDGDTTSWALTLWRQVEPELSLEQIALELGTSFRSLTNKARLEDFPERDGYRITPPPSPPQVRCDNVVALPAMRRQAWTPSLPCGRIAPAPTCQWPLWTDPPGILGAHPFCDAVSDSGSSYCPAHRARARARPHRKSLATQGDPL